MRSRVNWGKLSEKLTDAIASVKLMTTLPLLIVKMQSRTVTRPSRA